MISNRRQSYSVQTVLSSHDQKLLYTVLSSHEKLKLLVEFNIKFIVWL